MLYVFRERTSLGRWDVRKVAFMPCIFTTRMKSEYLLFKKDRRNYKINGILHEYGIGELPAHGRTKLMWDLDIDRMYIPLNVGDSHWISMCVNFVTRSIEVFDCEGLKYKSEVEPFAVLIPRIVKAVQSSNSKLHKVTAYDVTYVQMPKLNTSRADCGAYALKHIECHVLGLDFSLVHDGNIREARQKIAYDIWEAANDPEFILRMSEYTPPKTFSEPPVVLE